MSKGLLKVLTIVGTRPDTIKMAPVIFELMSRNNIQSVLCGSGQHQEMLQQALDIFGLIPDIDLKVMTQNQKLESLTSKLITAVSEIILEITPDIVIVHGDTTTAFCGALAAFYNRIPVVHVEAGLRTHDVLEPFPEEFNRQTIARIADLNLAPTKAASDNLYLEGIKGEKIITTGNTIIDSLNLMATRINKERNIQNKISDSFKEYFDFDYTKSKFVLITMHRRENIGNGITSVCEAISITANKFPEVKFVFPVHLNPAVSKSVHAILDNISNIYLISPLPYDEFVALLSNSLFIITDSGGIQEESVSLGKRALVTRNQTERNEGVENGLLQIVATDSKKIAEIATNIILNPMEDSIPIKNPFGTAGISKNIVDQILLRYLK
jgi:UDP-N-acetylglucosamine 2-epimerase (non-hydrolysing)